MCECDRRPRCCVQQPRASSRVCVWQGRIDIDHGRAELDIVCSGRDSSARRHAAAAAALSGGERSYFTVAFIMALWDCVELPFCFMDEFDVFLVRAASAALPADGTARVPFPSRT